MSEEEKLILNERGLKFDFMTQLRLVLSNKAFKMTSLASVFIMVSNDQVHKILEILHYEIFE